MKNTLLFSLLCAILAIAVYIASLMTPQHRDYQISIDSQDEITLWDEGRKVGTIQYSDSSDVWQMIIKDNE